jgi:SAM-dependent methyltransferase
MAFLRAWLEHPALRGLSIDDPAATAARRRLTREKPFLRRIYEEWYAAIAGAVPKPDPARLQLSSDSEAALEIGSGAGFLAESGLIPRLVTSDLLPVPGVDRVIDARSLPFADGSLRAIVMTNTLHHIPEPRRFLAEAVRCVRPGGVLSMIEPWNTPWSAWVYMRLHHEPFVPAAATWEFPSTGPLSGANGALPWILFARDRAVLEREFPWRVESVRLLMPFRYLLSGGVSMRSLAPGWTSGACRFIESLMRPALGGTAMFAHITARRLDPPS